MIKTLLEEDFIKEIKNVVCAGDGIAPLTGAGASARSGIMVGRDFEHYLSWVIFCCLGKPKDPPAKSTVFHDLREVGWLARPTAQEILELTDWVDAKFRAIASSHGVRFSPKDKNPRELIFLAGDKAPGPGDPAWSRPRLPRVLDGPYKIGGEVRKQDEDIRRLLAGKPVDDYLYKLSDPNCRIDSDTGLQEVAIRVMFDWRAMLDFLSRIAVRNGRAILSEQDESVIDSFHQFITRGRKPNLTHSMLAQLAGPFRTRVFFTTNFDSLQEEAFRALKLPFERLSVSKRQGLPAVHTVRAVTPVIKLHGSYTGTRADFSLDVPPSPEECAKFFYYFMGRWPDRPFGNSRSYVPSHLLVIGVSGSDIRILHFLKFLLDETQHSQVAKPTIFWVCYDDWGKQKIEELFKGNEYEGRVVATVTDRSDLLLLELYQAITLTLPKGGTSYHYAHDVPPQPWPGKAKDAGSGIPAASPAGADYIWDYSHEIEGDSKSQNATVLARIVQSVEKIKGAQERNECPPDAEVTVIVSKDGQPGLTPMVTEIFKRVGEKLRKEVLWIELEDFYDVPDTVHYLLHVIALRRGVFQLEHATLLPGRMVEKRERIKSKPDESNPGELRQMWREVLDAAQSYLGEALGDYVVCFYGRNVPGSCVGWAEQGHRWTSEDYDELHVVFELLSKKHLHVLYVPLTEDRIEEDNRKIELLVGHNSRSKPPLLQVEKKHADMAFRSKVEQKGWYEPALYPQRTLGERKSMVDELKELRTMLLKKAENLREPELRLLYSVSLFRQSRPPSVFLADPLYPSSPGIRFNDRGIDSDLAKKKTVDDWLKVYRKAELMWRKPGGNSWMYRDALLGLRLILENPPPTMPWDFDFRNTKSRTHFWIARWYFRAFCSSNHVVPLLESFFHFHQCAISLEDAQCPKPGRFKDRQIKIDEPQYRAQRLVRVLTEWIKVMRIGRPSLQFWLDRPASEGWLSEDSSNLVLGEIQMTIGYVVAEIRAQTDVLNLFIGPVQPQTVGLGHYLWQLQVMLELELERCRLSLKRGLFFMAETAPSVVHGEAADVISVEIPKVDIFINAPKKPAALKTQWCPTLDKLKGRKARDGGKMANEIVRRLMVEDDEAEGYYLMLKGEALGHLKTTDDYNSALPVALCILKERLYSLVRFAKSIDLEEALRADALDATKEPGKASQPKPLLPSRRGSRRYWRRVNILGRVIFDLCAFCPPALLRLDMNVRVSVLTLRALAHGRLGRFYQAHRRLNEAHAILTRVSPGVEEGDLFAFIELRRAEVYLLEADQVERLLDISRDSNEEKSFKDIFDDAIALDLFAVEAGRLNKEQALSCSDLYEQLCELYGLDKNQKKQEHLSKLLAAKLDDAWAALEGAEHLLSGQTRAALSWGRLCTLKLRVFAHHRKGNFEDWKLLAFRRRQDLKGELSKWLRLGFANWADDPYRQLRLAWYFVKARINWSEHQEEGQPLFNSSNQSDVDDIKLISTLTKDWGYEEDRLIRINEMRTSFYAIAGARFCFVNPIKGGLLALTSKGKVRRSKQNV